MQSEGSHMPRHIFFELFTLLASVMIIEVAAVTDASSRVNRTSESVVADQDAGMEMNRVVNQLIKVLHRV
jgi:hypothetical protein